jgi:hypothetical protein
MMVAMEILFSGGLILENRTLKQDPGPIPPSRPR